MIIILMGVAGCGKTAVGKALAKKLGYPFFDGDDFHSETNKKKMASHVPLTDADRLPWLKSIAAFIDQHTDMVLACSALKKSYRDILRVTPTVQFVYLKGDKVLIKKRIEERKGHFFKSDLIDSQFRDLEEPDDAIVVEINHSIPEIVNRIKQALMDK